MPRLQPQTTGHRSPFPQRWDVPPHLRGLACQACGCFFQDGESHGEVDLDTGVVICQTRVISARSMLSTGYTPPDLEMCRW